MESSQAKEENANFNFGLNYFKADQYEDAWRHFSIAAKEGCKESQTYLGIICWMVYNDPDTAKIYFEEARKHKEINAIYQLARLYENEGKIAEAISYYNEAIKGGHANAENKLGMLYFNEKDFDKAEELFISASKNNLDAQCNLGNLYISLDKIESAEECFKAAASKGSLDAQLFLGRLYIENENLIEAEKCFLYLLHNTRYVESFCYLGLICSRKQQFDRAKIYYSLAAVHGCEDAKKILEGMEEIA